jgi:ADP-ribosylglycohydrolase
VLPNIGIIILSLLYGALDKEDPLGRSICIAAMMGLDTDCNCGNIGAILGAQLGAEKIPSKWKDPLQDTFSTYVKGYEKWKITELAQRIADIGKKVIKEKCSGTVEIVK